METIYSLILWKKLNEKCEIHKLSFDEIEKMFKEHLDKVGYLAFKGDVKENSFLDVSKDDMYYDGQFYKHEDSHHKDQVKQDPSDPERLIVKSLYHESMAESTILTLMMEHLTPETSQVLANIHKAWFEKMKTETHDKH